METTEQQLEKIGGSVERVTFHSEESGFCVLRVKVRGQRDLVTVTGRAACIHAGEYLDVTGFWNNDKTHGLQFKAQEIKIIPPTTLEGIEKYLASGMIKGIGAHFAKMLVHSFGANVFDVIEQTPGKLLSLPGIGKKRKNVIIKAWAEQKVVRDIMVFLQSHGVGTARAVRIYKTYGDQAIEIVTNNPYRLASDIHGIGFKTADQLAMQLGIEKQSLLRAQAGVCYTLQTFSQQGHCAAPFESLKEKAIELLEIEEAIITHAIQNEINDENVIAENINEDPSVFLAPLYHAEVSVAKQLKCMQADDSATWQEVNANKAIPWVEEKNAIQLSPSQKLAIETALKNKTIIITGGPGVGKTTLVNSILTIIRAKRINIGLCAPTGRAAKRLSESTGMQAKTIHRLLEFDPKSYAFKYNAENPLPIDLLVVDEASMLDIVLFNQLLKAIPPQAGLFLVGDVDQLPSVGPGCVLADLIQSESIATIKLTEIFRQAADSQIIVNSHRINQGEMPEFNQNKSAVTDFYVIPVDDVDQIQDKLLQVVKHRIPKRFGFDPIQDIQVLTAMNRGGIGSRSLNIALQSALNSNDSAKVTRFGWTFSVGDKVIQTINNYDKEVFNGDIGYIVSIDLQETTLTINFDDNLVEYGFSELDELSLAYATSIHKSQGSEYPVVVIPLAMQNYMMLAKNLIYTGVTRGKKLVIIICETKALGMAVRNVSAKKRLTNLTARLRRE